MPESRRPVITMPRIRSASGARADQEREPLWAIQIIEHPSGISGRGAQVRVKPEMVYALRSGEAQPEDLIGTVDQPGHLRRALNSILPAICLEPSCVVKIILQDAAGRLFIPQKKLSAREEAERLFSCDDSEGD